MVRRRPIQGASEGPVVRAELRRDCGRDPGVSSWWDYGADWCEPTHTIAPVLEDLAAASEDQVTPAKVNVVENPGLATRHEIRSVPTILFVKEGPVRDPLVGAVPKTVLRRHLDRASLVS
jgi:thioredoxin 1